MDSTKANSEGIEHAAWEKEQTAPSKADAPVKRCQADSLSVWHFARQFKMASLIAMIAAFSASLDGYQINLNGGIVSNQGFIQQMATKGTTIIQGKYISAWGRDSTSRPLFQYATDRLGRKMALYIIWIVLVVHFYRIFCHNMAALTSGQAAFGALVLVCYNVLCRCICPRLLQPSCEDSISTHILFGLCLAKSLLPGLSKTSMKGTRSISGHWAVFQGRNFIRFIIASWPKIAQQFVGLAVFNTYATYFCYPYAVAKVAELCLGIIGCFNYTKPSTSSLLVFCMLGHFFDYGSLSDSICLRRAEVPSQRLALCNLAAILLSFCAPLMINGDLTQWGVKTAFFFPATGPIAVVIAWFILPEVTRRTPAEIDEMFEKILNLRKFKRFVTDVQMNADQYDQHLKA